MTSRAEVDRLLYVRRKRKACYPCASRKVKCNGISPCATCVRRNHPEICIVDDSQDASNESGRAVRRRAFPPERRESPSGLSHSVIASNPGDHNPPMPADYTNHRQVSEPTSHEQTLNQRAHENHVPSTTEEPSLSFVGVNSTLSFVHGSPFASDAEFGKEIGPALGLQNTSGPYPFMRGEQSSAILGEPEQLFPSHAEILK